MSDNAVVGVAKCVGACPRTKRESINSSDGQQGNLVSHIFQVDLLVPPVGFSLPSESLEVKAIDVQHKCHHHSSAQEGHMSPERLCNLFTRVLQHSAGTCSACIGAISQPRPLLDHSRRVTHVTTAKSGNQIC